MAPASLRLRSTETAYGPVCPRCAGPKGVQASECIACFHERLRGANYWRRRACPDCGAPKSVRAARCKPCADKRLIGNTHAAGRAQPAEHPWRHDLIGRFETRRPTER